VLVVGANCTQHLQWVYQSSKCDGTSCSDFDMLQHIAHTKFNPAQHK